MAPCAEVYHYRRPEQTTDRLERLLARVSQDAVCYTSNVQQNKIDESGRGSTSDAVTDPKVFRLDLGAGRNKARGCIGVDVVPLPGIDIVADLNGSLPFRSESVDEILCSHTLEHLEAPVRTLEEFHRVLKSGKSLHLRLPHYTNNVGFQPFHRHFFSITWLDVTDESTYLGVEFSYCTRARFKIIERHVTLQKGRFVPWSYLIESLINRSYGLQCFWETYFSFVFPAIETRWIAVKCVDERAGLS